jgi:Leucine-rich repeat (LRR) protein
LTTNNRSSPLALLTKLTTLDLSRNENVTDLSPLASLSGLRTLYFSGTALMLQRSGLAVRFNHSSRYGGHSTIDLATIAQHFPT